MGISGLLPFLKDIEEECHVRRLKGKRVGVDTYCWLHKGTYGCALDLATSTPTAKYIEYCLFRAKMLQYYGITPVMVFDGRSLPAKKETEKERRSQRDSNKKKAMEYLRVGNRTKALEHFQRCVDVTTGMAYRLIQALKKNKIEYIVAPYEADAQLAYMIKSDIIDAVITEDSDLLAYGAHTVLFKLDKFGEGKLIKTKNFGNMKASASLRNFTEDMFRHLCIFAGCDFLPNIPNLGLRKAHKLLKTHRHHDLVVKKLRFVGHTVSVDYGDAFIRADNTFRYQRVYCPKRQKMVTLTELPDELKDEPLEYVGPMMSDSLVKGIATGELEPFSGLPYSEDRLPPVPNEFLSSLEETSSIPTPVKVSTPFVVVPSMTKPKTPSAPVQSNNLFAYMHTKSSQATRVDFIRPRTSQGDDIPRSGEREAEDDVEFDSDLAASYALAEERDKKADGDNHSVGKANSVPTITNPFASMRPTSKSTPPSSMKAAPRSRSGPLVNNILRMAPRRAPQQTTVHSNYFRVQRPAKQNEDDCCSPSPSKLMTSPCTPASKDDRYSKDGGSPVKRQASSLSEPTEATSDDDQEKNASKRARSWETMNKFRMSDRVPVSPIVSPSPVKKAVRVSQVRGRQSSSISSLVSRNRPTPPKSRQPSRLSLNATLNSFFYTKNTRSGASRTDYKSLASREDEVECSSAKGVSENDVMDDDDASGAAGASQESDKDGDSMDDGSSVVICSEDGWRPGDDGGEATDADEVPLLRKGGVTAEGTVVVDFSD